MLLDEAAEHCYACADGDAPWAAHQIHDAGGSGFQSGHDALRFTNGRAECLDLGLWVHECGFDHLHALLHVTARGFHALDRVDDQSHSAAEHRRARLEMPEHLVQSGCGAHDQTDGDNSLLHAGREVGERVDDIGDGLHDGPQDTIARLAEANE